MQVKTRLLCLLCIVVMMLPACKSSSSLGNLQARELSSDERSLLRYYNDLPAYEVSTVLPENMAESDRLNRYFDDRHDSAFFAPFLDSIRLKYPVEWEYVDHLVRYVQENIRYEENNPGMDIKHAFQTFTIGSGICSDQSVLLGKLLVYSGYNVALFTFDEAEHIALGLKVPAGYGSFKTPYVYIETTNIRPIGDIPEDSFEPGLLRNPGLVEIVRNGNSSFTSVRFLMKHYREMQSLYGDDFVFLDQKSRFMTIRINSLQHVDSLKANLDGIRIRYDKTQAKLTQRFNEMQNLGCNGVISDDETYDLCASHVKKYNALVEETNALSETMEKESGITNLLVMELNKLINDYNAHIEEQNSRNSFP